MDCSEMEVARYSEVSIPLYSSNSRLNGHVKIIDIVIPEICVQSVKFICMILLFSLPTKCTSSIYDSIFGFYCNMFWRKNAIISGYRPSLKLVTHCNQTH